MTHTLYLASTSVFRKALLEKLTSDFATAKPEVDETPLAAETPDQLVLRLSAAKAKAVADQLALQQINALVIGSDQVALHQGRILGKPHTAENAFAQLKSFSGTEVEFLTGLSVIDNVSGAQQTLLDSFNVKFRQLTDAEIWRYIEREQPLQCAGSFKSEGLGITLFEKMQGDDPNSLIGLPLIKLHALLKEFGLDLLLNGR
jgi:MAF protein